MLTVAYFKINEMYENINHHIDNKLRWDAFYGGKLYPWCNPVNNKEGMWEMIFINYSDAGSGLKEDKVASNSNMERT